MNKQEESTSTENIHIPIKENINAMVNCAWQLTLHSLWPHCDEARNFEIDSKKIIRRLIMTGNDHYEKYLEYCQQVLLCWRILLDEYAFGQTELPLKWFNTANPNGFKVGRLLYKFLVKERKTDPLSNYEIKALAEAILEMAELPCKTNFNYWKNWFAERYAYDEYILFYMCCIKNRHNFKY